MIKYSLSCSVMAITMVNLLQFFFLVKCTRLSFAMTHHILITAKRLGKTLKQNPLGRKLSNFNFQWTKTQPANRRRISGRRLLPSKKYYYYSEGEKRQPKIRLRFRLAKTLHQNILSHIAFFFTLFKGYSYNQLSVKTPKAISYLSPRKQISNFKGVEKTQVKSSPVRLLFVKGELLACEVCFLGLP